MPARKKPTDAGHGNDGPDFEAAYAELEEIVAAMEEQQLPLEELVDRYEKGSKLLKRCETVLASARKRLQTITARAEAAGEETSDADEDDELTGAPAENDDDDDIRLF